MLCRAVAAAGTSFQSVNTDEAASSQVPGNSTSLYLLLTSRSINESLAVVRTPCLLHAPNLSLPSALHLPSIVCRRWAWLTVLQPKIFAATDTCTTADPGIAATACV
jgi:hypothetical protein